jgi:hypothetical protein
MYFQESEEIQLVLKLPALTITVQQRRSTLELFVILNLRGYMGLLCLTPLSTIFQY